MLGEDPLDLRIVEVLAFEMERGRSCRICLIDVLLLVDLDPVQSVNCHSKGNLLSLEFSRCNE